MEIIIFKKDEIPLFVFNGKKTEYNSGSSQLAITSDGFILEIFDLNAKKEIIVGANPAFQFLTGEITSQTGTTASTSPALMGKITTST